MDAKKNIPGKVDIFEYADFRVYLRDVYEFKKAIDKKFSHRYFAQKAGIKSTGFYSEVMQGKRNLTSALILKFSRALELREEEKIFFENMVLFNQSKTVDEKNRYFEKMVSINRLKMKLVGADQYELYSKWYYSAIREFLCFYRFKGDYITLGKCLNPPINPRQAKKAIKTLERLGLIKKGADGFYSQTSHILTTGELKVKSLSISNFQRETIKLAGEALDRIPASERDISTLTLSLSPKHFEMAKNEIAALRKKLLAISERSEKELMVFQINFQAFPLSRMEKKDQ